LARKLLECFDRLLHDQSLNCLRFVYKSFLLHVLIMSSNYKQKDRTLQQAQNTEEFKRQFSPFPDAIYEKPSADPDNPSESDHFREERMQTIGEKKARELGFL
jgi:hypothetical protein